MTSNNPWGLHGIWLRTVGDPDPQHVSVAIRVHHKLLVETLGAVVLHFQMLNDATPTNYREQGVKWKIFTINKWTLDCQSIFNWQSKMT